MNTYHKIHTVYKRDPETKFKTLLEGEFSLPEFEYLANNQWVWTEKVDGTNIRIIVDEGKVVFRGKTDRAMMPTPLGERLEERFSPQFGALQEMFHGGRACLYGEGYGAKIQKGGGNYREDQDFVLFDVAVDGWWLRREDVNGIAKTLGIDVVPIAGQGTLLELVASAREGIPSAWGDFQAEGYVARPATELQARNGTRLITKIKCRDFR